ncbi:MAG: hypothetical protein ACREF3_04265, partial [Acetobacteraceae bacterium]
MPTMPSDDERRRSDPGTRGVEPFVGLIPFIPDSVWFDRHWNQPEEEEPSRPKRRRAHRTLAFVAGLIVLSAGGSLVVHHYA